MQSITNRTGVLILLVATLANACFTSGPRNNSRFAGIEKIEDLEGVYKNEGESGYRGPSSFYLSKVIWPEDKELDHKTVETIEVRKAGEKQLVVKALSKDGVKKESTFVEGKDFQISDGRIRLETRVGFSGNKRGEVIVGPYTELRELGLDTAGHGKLRQSFSVVGMVFLFMPFAGGGHDDVRFVRVKE